MNPVSKGSGRKVEFLDEIIKKDNSLNSIGRELI